MLKLNEQGLQARKDWENAGYALPQYDRAAVTAATKKAPAWIHFGAGNIFRAFQANLMQQLLNKGLSDTGLVVAEGYDYEIIQKMYRPHDNYSVLVTLKADGTVEKTVVGSIVESLVLDSGDVPEYDRLKAVFTSDGLQMASFTITEKGYSLTNARGILLPDISYDLDHGPEKPESYLGKMVSLLYARYCAGQKPIAMVSMDNCSHNGSKLYAAVTAFSEKWSAAGLCDSGFDAYVKDPSKVSFPWSMIDKITPRPDPSVQEMLIKDGLEDAAPVVTTKHSYVAPFVNAEECQYLVVEDRFPNGRPPLEQAGVLFTDRATVDKVEKMKVCTCLNPLHTCLAVFGCVLGYTGISAEMKDPELVKLIRTIGYKEGLPVVVDPGVLNPKEFLDAVLNVRLPNPFMPDTPQRIATDTSQKLAIRYGETIKAYEASDTLDVKDLKMIPLVFAGWLRYLMGVDDNGAEFTLSPDPLLETLRPYLADYKLGSPVTAEGVREKLTPVLSNEKIFGVNLIEAGMADLVCRYFVQLIAGPGAVRATLKKYTD